MLGIAAGRLDGLDELRLGIAKGEHLEEAIPLEPSSGCFNGAVIAVSCDLGYTSESSFAWFP
jgi:hypothetical protein